MFWVVEPQTLAQTLFSASNEVFSAKGVFQLSCLHLYSIPHACTGFYPWQGTQSWSTACWSQRGLFLWLKGIHLQIDPCRLFQWTTCSLSAPIIYFDGQGSQRCDNVWNLSSSRPETELKNKIYTKSIYVMVVLDSCKTWMQKDCNLVQKLTNGRQASY